MDDKSARNTGKMAQVNVATCTKQIQRNKTKSPGGDNEHIFRVGMWLSFCVGIALTPILSDLIVSGITDQQFTWQKALAHGDLAAISIAIMGEALGYLLTNPKASSTLKGYVGIGCVIVLIGGAILLGALSVESIRIDTLYVMRVSLILFLGTLILGSFCKWTER